MALLRSSEGGTGFRGEKIAVRENSFGVYRKENEDRILQMLFDKQRSKVSVPNGYKRRNPHRCKFLPTIYYEQNFLRFGLPNERLDEFDFFQRIDNQLERVFHVVVQSYGVTNQSFAHAHLLLDFLRNFR